MCWAGVDFVFVEEVDVVVSGEFVLGDDSGADSTLSLSGGVADSFGGVCVIATGYR